MTHLRSDQIIDQAFFGWSYSQLGLGLLANSFRQSEDVSRWSSRLRNHIRLYSDDGEPPLHALSYFTFSDGTAAVLRRTDVGHSNGRNNSHALIGPADVLTVTAAVALGNSRIWREQTPPEGRMPAFDMSILSTLRDPADDMRLYATRNARAISQVLARLLEDPSASLSIVGCEEENVLPMVWALHGAADSYLRHYGTHRQWSFSTYEVRHDDSVEHLPAIVFLPSRPRSPGVVNRTIVDLTAASHAVDATQSAQAEEFIKLFLHGARSASPEPVYVQAGVSASRPSEARAGATSPMSVHAEKPADQYHSVLNGPQLIRELVQTRVPRDFLQILGKLESLSSGPDSRRELRSALDINAMNRFANTAESDVPDDLTRRMLTVAYGPELKDLTQADALGHARDVIESCRSTRVAKALAIAAREYGGSQVMSAVVNRWMEGDEPAVIVSSRTGRPRPQVRSRRVPRDVAIRVAAVAGVLGVVFLLGFLLGRPDVAEAGSATSPPPSSTAPASAAAGKPRSSSLPVAGQVTITKAEAQDIFSFIRMGTVFYPQSLCQAMDAITWQCARNSAPPDKPAVEPILVAVSVPADQLVQLQTLAAEGRPTQKGAGWGTPVPVTK